MTDNREKSRFAFCKKEFMIFSARSSCFPAGFLQKRMYRFTFGGSSDYPSGLMLDFLKFINFILSAVIPHHVGIFQNINCFVNVTTTYRYDNGIRINFKLKSRNNGYFIYVNGFTFGESNSTVFILPPFSTEIKL